MAVLLTAIRPVWFFAAFAVGLLMCYILTPQPEVIVRFPSPYNAGKVVYRDKAQNCFTYNATEVSCPKDPSRIKLQPVATA